MTAPSVRDLLDETAADSVDPRYVDKVERMKNRMSDEEIARFLWDRGKLDGENVRKYGFHKTMSNVSASEIPEEAPDYVGDVGTAEAAGLKQNLSAAANQTDEGIEDLDEDDGEELTAKSPKPVLEAEAEQRGLSTAGTRQEIFDRIVEYDEAQAAG